MGRDPAGTLIGPYEVSMIWFITVCIWDGRLNVKANLIASIDLKVNHLQGQKVEEVLSGVVLKQYNL